MLPVAFAALLLLSVKAMAEYPDRPINMIIPDGAGGASDISARAIAAPLVRAAGQPLVMTNVTGAGGVKGMIVAKNSNADGYTMLFARVGTHAVSPAMKATLPYQIEDFEFIGVYELNPVACAVSAKSDINSMDDLIEKAKNGRISYSSGGVGTLLHLAGATVLSEFGIENPLETVTHIPLRGGGVATTAVLNGTATFVCTNTSTLANFVENGLLRPLLVTANDRLEGFDAPTVSELGKPELQLLVGWTGIVGPAELPENVALMWEEWIEEAVKNEEFVEVMESRGSLIQFMDPEQSNTFILRQFDTFRLMVDNLGLRISQ